MAIFLVLASPPMLHGAFVDGIDVISQNYQMDGGWVETSREPPFPSVSGGYSLSSSDGTPLAASTTSPDGRANANASIDQFSLHNSYTYRPSLDFTIGSSGASASAQGVWDFHPADALLQLNLAISAHYSLWGAPYHDWRLTVGLTDMTTSTTLLDVVNPINTPIQPGFNGLASYVFGVNPSDVYEFSVYAQGGPFADQDQTLEDITASIKSAATAADFPDGGLTIGMLGMAIGGLALMRRKLNVCG